MTHTTLILLLGLAVTTPAGAAPAAPPAEAAAVAAPREAARPLDKAMAVSVRGAPLADVLARASDAGHLGMTATGPAADQRITLYAARTTLGELQDALRTLLRLRVSRRGTEADQRYVLSYDPRQAAQADAWRLRQADAALQAVLRTAGAMTAGRAEETARATLERFRREHPAFPPESLTAIDAGYLRQSLLFTPLTPAARGQLVQAGWLSLPIAALPPASQLLLATFAQSGAGRATITEESDEYSFFGPRVQYRLLYGDRWTDRMLLAQVGASGAWSSAMMPSILFRQKDDSSLYPDAADRPDDPDVWRRLPPRFETAGKDWDALLVDLAHTMQIKLAADSYARPWLFNTDQPLPDIAGIPLRDALDRLCQERGCFWWKQNGWYFVRSRTWVEESRVAVPDRLLRGWLQSARLRQGLSEQELLQIAALSDEQLLTLQMQSGTPGETEFLGPGFDPDSAALMANALLMFRSLPPPQRELALGDGLPALWLPPAQQNLFAAVAAQYRMPLLPEEADRWSFRLRQEFVAPRQDDSTRSANRPDRLYGSLMAEWRFGSGRTMRASLPLNDRSLHQKVDSEVPSEAR